MRMAMKKSSYGSILLFTTPILMIAITLAVSAGNEVGRLGENLVPRKTIETVLNENNSRLLSIPGVIGTAESVCNGAACVKVYVIKESPELTRPIPKVIDGYPVVIEETGEVHALPKNPAKGK
jgi:hypothetical protein